MADKDDDFDTKQLYPESVQDEIAKEEAAKKAEQERADYENQSSGDDVATPLPEPRPDGDMAQDAAEVMRRNEEARMQEKVNQHLELHDQKEEIRQRGNENVNIREDFDNAQER